jgi:TonB-linked SusC/RagA family outer membrane protein
MYIKIENYSKILGVGRNFFSLNFLNMLTCSVLLMLTAPISAQSNSKQIVVRGIVRDSHTKKPIMAAQVSVVNSNQATSTDDKGCFKIVIPTNNTLLRVSAFDYSVCESAVRGNDSLTINLYPDKFTSYYKNIDGINGFVNNSTNANSTVSTNNVDQTVAFTADQLLQTAVAGDLRTINRSAQIGQGSSLFIRGLNSINANSQPLFVVDGIIWTDTYSFSSVSQGLTLNPLTNIDMEDVESISVVKDGTSLYGSKGANGVVLIKTKRASEMMTKISFNMVAGVTTIPTIMPLMGATDYKIYSTELLGSSEYTLDQISKLPYISEDSKRATYKIYHNNTNWVNEIYNSAVSQSYNINVKGGDEKALYYFSLGYTNNDGIVKKTNFQRYNIRYNGDINMAKNVNVKVNVGFARVDRNVYDDGVNIYTSPTWLSLIKSPLISPNTFSFLGERTTEYSTTDIFNTGNPSAVLDYSTNTVKQNNFNVGFKPVVRINKNLSLSENFDYSLNKINEDSYRPMYFTTPIYVEGYGDTENSRSSQVIRNNSIFNDLRLSYNKKLLNSTLNIFAGNRYIINSLEAGFVEGYNSGSNSSVNLMGGFSHLQTTGINNLTKSISNYLNIDYNYDNRYMLALTASLDASSRFGNETKSGISIFNHNWGLFPAINGAWLVSSESFMKNISAINLLKIRAGYGITGNDDVKDYQTQTYFSGIRYSGVINGMVISNLANNSIQWETTKRVNVGIDLSIFNNRLFVSADLYEGRTENLLVQKDYQDAVGLDKYWTNDGTMTNKGVEVSFNAKLLNLKSFAWEFGASAGHYINHIDQLGNGTFYTQVYDGEVQTAVNGPVGVFYGYKSLGVFATDKEASTAFKGTNYLTMKASDGSISKFSAGDIHFEDMNGDGVIDGNDKQVIGNPNPDVYGSITNKFTYKNLTFTAMFTYSYGNQIYNYMRSQLEAGKDFSNQSTAMLTRWTAENQITTQPKTSYGDPLGNSRFSDRWIEDGSYIRLKSLSLSYYLPLKVSFMESVNIWVSGNNLYTFTHYLGLDPESSSMNGSLYQGVDAGLLPASKNFNIGLKFNL